MRDERFCQESRAALRRAVRSFFDGRGYLEIETPIAVTCPGTETHLGYFATEWRPPVGESRRLFLRSSPELHMKQALAGGMNRVYQMGACFRNGVGEISEWHHPEFTMLEWYEAGVGFERFVDLTESLLRETREAFAGWLGREPSITLPTRIPRLSVAEAFDRFARVELVDNDPTLAVRCRAAGVVSVNVDDDFETAYFKTLIEKIEPGLASLGCAFLWDYPPSQAALARVENGVAKRFEMYVGRVELCNGFGELVDPAENARRMSEAQAARRGLGIEVVPYDPDFDAALRLGVPPSCGNALGFDRWLALLIGDHGIDRVVPFRRSAAYRSAL